MSDVASPAVGSRRSRVLSAFSGGSSLVVGGTIIAVIVMLAALAPWIAQDPNYMDIAARLEGPSAAHWLGTDNFGRDIFSRTLYGARVSLVVGLAAAALAVAIGLPIGLLSGFYRVLDAILMRIMEGLMAIPTILLAIALITAVSNAGVLMVIAAIAIPDSPRIARLVRSVVLRTREMTYVEAAVSIGNRDTSILVKHIMPSTFPPLVVQATYLVAAAILVEAGLSFLGTGISQEWPTWGNMISSNRLYLASAPWTVFFPGLMLTLTILAVNLVGDGLRDRLDPRAQRQL